MRKSMFTMARLMIWITGLIVVMSAMLVSSFNYDTVAQCHRHVPRLAARSMDSLPEEKGMLGEARAVFKDDGRPVILYDGVCNMCNSWVDRVLSVDVDKKFRFSALQGPTGRALLAKSGRSPDDISRSVGLERVPPVVPIPTCCALEYPLLSILPLLASVYNACTRTAFLFSSAASYSSSKEESVTCSRMLFLESGACLEDS